MRSADVASFIALQSVAGLGAASLGRLLARFGSAEGVLGAAPDELAAVPKVPHLLIEDIRAAARRLDVHRETARRLLAEGVRPLAREEPDYPARLNVLASPPPLLYVRGHLPRGNRRTFGIVGTTEPSEHGLEITIAIAHHLARRGWVVVSGNAPGIDAAAHRGALRARRPTIMVLPTGILQFRPHHGYPPPEVLWRFAAAVCECHPDAPWTTPAALARNRLIAALSDAVLVVEARERGGALSTIRHAIALGRRAFAVRFRAPALSASGNPAAEAAGALPVRSIRELDLALARGSPPPGQQGLPW